MRKIIIEDIYTIAEQMIDLAAPNKVIGAVGYYDTIQELFNILIKSDNEYEFVAGQLEPEEWDNYDEAWYLQIDDDVEMYVGKMQYDGHDEYISLESDYDFVEEDFLDQYLENNSSYGVIAFGFDDVHDEPDGEFDSADDEFNNCLCMDKDNYGFTFCACNEYGHHKFKYRSNKKLTEDEAWDIVAENYH